MGDNRQDWKNDTDFINFVRWDCLPRHKKEEAGHPRTVTGYAEKIGVDRRTIQRWRHKPEYDELKNEFLQGHLAGADARVLQSMAEVAEKTDPKAHKDRENLLTLLGYSPNQETVRHEGEVTHTVEDARVMDTESLRRHAKSRLKEKPEMQALPDAAVDGAVEALLDMVGAPQEAVTGADSADDVKEAEQLPSGEAYVLSAGENPEDWTTNTPTG